MERTEMSNTHNADELLTKGEAAAELKVSIAWLERRIRERKLVAYKLHRLTRIRRADLDALIATAPRAQYRPDAA
jgi:excisionase family DNA binding protein